MLIEKGLQGTFCREQVENRFKVFEGARGTYARIKGQVETRSETTETTYGWEGYEYIILPEVGEVPFTYTMDGARRYYQDEYVATPEGVFRTYSMHVVYK